MKNTERLTVIEDLHKDHLGGSCLSSNPLEHECIDNVSVPFISYDIYECTLQNFKDAFNDTLHWIVESVSEGDANFMLQGWFSDAKCWVTVVGEQDLSGNIYGVATYFLSDNKDCGKKLAHIECSNHYRNAIRSTNLNVADFPMLHDELLQSAGASLLNHQSNVGDSIAQSTDVVIDGLLSEIQDSIEYLDAEPLFDGRQVLLSLSSIEAKASALSAKNQTLEMVCEDPSDESLSLAQIYKKAVEIIHAFPDRFKLPDDSDVRS